MKELKISVLGLTQSGKTTAIIHLAKNYNDLRCLCTDESESRTKILVRYHFNINNKTDKFYIINSNDDNSELKKEIGTLSEFSHIINDDLAAKQFNYAEAYLVPNEYLCKVLIKMNLQQIVLYDTRGLMDFGTEDDGMNGELKITDLTKVGIDKPDAILFFYAGAGSTKLKSIYTRLFSESFSSNPFFIFFRAEENDKKKYNNSIRGIFNFFKSIHIRLNFSIKVNDVEVEANFEYENKCKASVDLELRSENEIIETIPYFNNEKQLIYRLSEYDLNTLEDEDKYINELNDYIEKIVCLTKEYNDKISNEKLKEFFNKNELLDKITKNAMNDIKLYKGGSKRMTKYCYPERNQNIDYNGLIKKYNNSEILGPYGGITTRDGQLIYFYTVVMCTLMHNAIYDIFNSNNIDNQIKPLLKTILSRTNDSYYYNSFLIDRFIIKKSIEDYKNSNSKNDELLFNIVSKNIIEKFKEIVNLNLI